MSASEEAILLVKLVGAKETAVGLELVGEASVQTAGRIDAVGIAAERTSRRSFLMNQALFTMRRFLYLTTLGTIAFGAATIKWGYDYLSQMQQGQIALGKFMGSNRLARAELDKLFQFTAYTPFQFKDVVSAASMLMRFNISAGMTNRILRNVTDALAGTTKATPGGLNRIATALGHMMSMGHATGQVLLQLARDGIPGVYDAVKKYFGLSDEQMHHIGTLGLPSVDVLKAINQYVEQSHLHGLARREALGSLHGLLTTSRDFISRIMGQAMKPGFSAVQGWIVGINTHLQKAGTAIQQGKPVMPALFGAHPGAFGQDVEMIIGLYKNLWKILTQSVIPAFRIWLNIFQPLKLLLIVVGGIVAILAQHTTILKYAMILLFIAMSPRWILGFWSSLAMKVSELRTSILMFRIAAYSLFLQLKSLALTLARIPVILYETWVLRAEYATLLWGKITEITSGLLYALQFRLLLVQDALKAVTFWIQFQTLVALEALAGMCDTVALQALYMWDALLGPVGLVIAVIALFALLYWKWKPFHDIVNQTISFLWHHPLLSVFVPIIGPLITIARISYEIYKHWRDIYNMFAHPLRGLESFAGLNSPKGGGSIWGKIGGTALNIFGAVAGFPGLASGGSVVGGGWSWVGERGPELAWMPRGSAVMPASIAPNVFPWSGSQFSPQDGRPIQVQLVADGKVLAEVVAAHKDDTRARM